MHWVLPPPHLAEEIAAADALTFIGRTEGQGNVDLGNRDFQAADFNGPLNDFAVGNIGHHMFVGADTGGQNFRNIGVRQGREAPVNATGGGNTPFGADIAQGVDKCKDSVFVVLQYFLVIAGLNATEGHGRSVGKTKGEYGGRDIRTKGNDTGVPADLNAWLINCSITEVPLCWAAQKI